MIDVVTFQKKIFDFYQHNKRDFVWRSHINPYYVLVSEVMLQQTQTARVVVKFNAWILQFPDIFSLAAASTQQVLAAWQGLGYNRRALFLHQTAIEIVKNYQGVVPCDVEILQTLPGIGKNTAGSICAFAFNASVVFIETNIRTVFLYEFFNGKIGVKDSEILEFVALTLPKSQIRDWYYALMDYGVFLKIEMKKNNSASAHYVKQSKFIGSKRQVRGLIVKILTKNERMHHDDLKEAVATMLPDNIHNVDLILQTMQREKIVHVEHDLVRL